MRIVHVAPTALSSISAAWRIKAAQRQIGLDAIAAVQIGRESDQVFTFDKNQSLAKYKKRFYERLDSLPIRLSLKRNRELPLSSGWAGRNISSQINSLQPNIVNFHWLTNGSVNMGDISRINAPVVFTMHDVWPITGGCHCNLTCDKWSSGCNACPQFGSSFLGLDFAPLLLSKKEKEYAKISRLAIVCPSRWLAQMAEKSNCFLDRSVSVIPNCINLDIFQPADKFAAKVKLGLPTNSLIISFGAVNATSVSYKGYDLLQEIMQVLRARSFTNIHLLIFGANGSGSCLPFQTTFLGNIENERDLASIYQASDIFISPSRQDNFPSTVVEATACGTPVVAFDVGGVSDLIKHCETGFLAKAFDVIDFANGIEWLSASSERLLSAGYAASKFTSVYCHPKAVAQKYHELYVSII